MKSVTFAIFFILAFGMAAHAEVYKWVDADGNVHFSDTPPPNPEQEAEEVKIQSASSPARLDAHHHINAVLDAYQ